MTPILYKGKQSGIEYFLYSNMISEEHVLVFADSGNYFREYTSEELLHSDWLKIFEKIDEFEEEQKLIVTHVNRELKEITVTNDNSTVAEVYEYLQQFYRTFGEQPSCLTVPLDMWEDLREELIYGDAYGYNELYIANTLIFGLHEEPKNYVEHFELMNKAYEEHMSHVAAQALLELNNITINADNVIKPRRGWVSYVLPQGINTEEKKLCSCDLHTVIMRTGCQCGGS